MKHIWHMIHKYLFSNIHIQSYPHVLPAFQMQPKPKKSIRSVATICGKNAEPLKRWHLLWNYDSAYATMTTAMKRGQFLWQDDNLYKIRCCMIKHGETLEMRFAWFTRPCQGHFKALPRFFHVKAASLRGQIYFHQTFATPPFFFRRVMVIHFCAAETCPKSM